MLLWDLDLGHGWSHGHGTIYREIDLRYVALARVGIGQLACSGLCRNRRDRAGPAAIGSRRRGGSITTSADGSGWIMRIN